MEITCDSCLPRINNELERLRGILQPLMEVCEDEEEKFFRGEQSLYDVCIAVDCEVKLSAQSVARYVSIAVQPYDLLHIILCFL